MANSNWANITWSHNYSAGTDFVVKYITSKHQIAWGLYRVATPVEILPAPMVATLMRVWNDALWPCGGWERERHGLGC